MESEVKGEGTIDPADEAAECGFVAPVRFHGTKEGAVVGRDFEGATVEVVFKVFDTPKTAELLKDGSKTIMAGAARNASRGVRVNVGVFTNSGFEGGKGGVVCRRGRAVV